MNNNDKITNEEKAIEIATDFTCIEPCTLFVRRDIALAMAEWKDQQFIDLLYEWMNNGKIDVMNIEDLIKEI